MKLLFDWLKEFVEIPDDPEAARRRLTDAGVAVESVSQSPAGPILEAEITTNRPDCLSHYGVARELSTLYRRPLKKVDVSVPETGPTAAEAVNIEILNPRLCARYCARVIRDVEVKPSPEWLVRRLEAIGARPINNVADVTNYVLMELGHPLHAFDLDSVGGREIKVRCATPGETLRTLDGVERFLRSEDLIIADATRPVALAGVMGGEDSAISAATKTVLLESAWFDPVSVRRTAKAHRMHTEASHRFERGADIEMAPLALDRAAALIADLAGGSILRGALDVYPQPRRREKLDLSRAAIRRILGSDVPWEDVERVLRSLGFNVERRGAEGWGVTPPSFRLDVSREVDLIEEVARHYGYDRLPARLVPAPPRAARDEAREKAIALTQTLTSLGYREIITSPMVDPAENERFRGASSIVLENPLSQEASALRSTAVPSMLRALRWNLDRGQDELRLFEMGKIYFRDSGGEPRERRVLSLGLAGPRRASTIQEAGRDTSFLDLKGDLASLLALFDAAGVTFVPQASGIYDAQFAAAFTSDGHPLATFGRLGRDLSDGPRSACAIWLAEVDVERLFSFPLKTKSFHAFPRYPAVERDFSLVVPAGMSYAAVADAILRLKLPELVSFRPVEVFHGSSFGNGSYSLLLRVVFQNPDHTLSGEEIASLSQTILAALALEGIRLRT